MKTLSCAKECEGLCVSDNAKSAEESTRKIYPTLYLSDIEGLEDIPDSGEMTIKFVRKSRTVIERTEGGKDSDREVSVSLDIESITFDDAQGDKVSTSGELSLEELFDQSTRSSDED
jgi:hypothetical protein